MITLKKLRWDNCFSYGPGNVLDLEENTVTQIIGTNGMGKSSIPLIIEEALFNKNSKGIKKADIPNRYINNGYSIYLEFTKDSDKYTVSIDRKSNIKVAFLKNGEDVSSHTATNTFKTIQEVIGTDFKTFSQLVYQNTNASLQFLTATDTTRKKFLIDLLHLEEYVELFELFKGVSKDLSLEVSAIRSKIATVDKWLSDNKLSDTTVLPIVEIENDTEELGNQFRSLTKEIENISEKNKKISQNNQYIDLLKKAFSTNGLIAYKIENLVKELEELVNTYLGELSDGRFTLEFVVSNDKLNVQITDNGNIVDILALSSGELARVNTATLIAIRKLMSSISKSRINILFLDEVINVLDETGREKLVEVLLGEENLNTYVVSHGWTHPLLEKIEVVKRENVSALE